MPNSKIFLNKNQHKRILAGHLWIFSNEINPEKSDLKDFQPGQPVHVHAHGGTFLGHGYVNPASLISVRILGYQANETLEDLLEKRLASALALRRDIYSKPFYRLMFSESDLLPGLIIDRFDQVLSIQLNTAGMDRQRDTIVRAVSNLLPVDGVVFKNDTRSRVLEGLKPEISTTGSVPETGTVREGDLELTFSLAGGQKTGWYYDQSPNRTLFAGMCAGKKVLDVFSYVGALAAGAARQGASHVVVVDSSRQAMDLVHQNMAINRIPQGSWQGICSDAFEVLDSMARDSERFHAISLDPPAFIKRKKDFQSGLAAYQKLNSMAMELLHPGGIFMSCSCSQHLKLSQLVDIIRKAALKKKRHLRILRFCHQGPDHPIHPAMDETNYLKGVIFRVD